MRDILFRGKEPNTGKWVYGYVVSVADKSRCTIYVPQDPNDFNWATLPVAVDPDTVGQFTGLCDKNGAKIFEGDILKTYFGKFGYSKAVVKYGKGDFSCGAHFFYGWVFRDLEKNEELRMNYNDARYVSEYEVFGNIHDNPELLS